MKRKNLSLDELRLMKKRLEEMAESLCTDENTGEYIEMDSQDECTMNYLERAITSVIKAILAIKQ